MNAHKKYNRLGEEKLNHQGYWMRVIKYNNAHDIIVEFQDKFKAQVHTEYRNFKKGRVHNPYHKNVLGVGITGNKAIAVRNNKHAKEYITWVSMLKRCFDKKFKERNPSYKKVTCCNEWVLYENFYEWLHKQPNFEKWFNGDNWHLDKDILIKGNLIYSPETCCLVPNNVNFLFVKRDKYRGKMPIGVQEWEKTYRARCSNQLLNKEIHLGSYSTPDEAFQAYKQYKENYIKQIAQEEYEKGNITKRCYEAMLNYKVEITD